MKWEVEYTDEFGNGWATLTEPEQESVKATVELLGEFGPNLRYPHSSGIAASKHDPLRELRIQHAGRPYRVLYAFDPRRCAILLRGGDQTGNPHGYDEHVPRAGRLYDAHLAIRRVYSMAKKFSELVAQMSPESRARSDALYRQLRAEVPLQELRKALERTQQPVAASLGVNPVAVYKMESQTDMYVSTLRRFVAASKRPGFISSCHSFTPSGQL